MTPAGPPTPASSAMNILFAVSSTTARSTLPTASAYRPAEPRQLSASTTSYPCPVAAPSGHRATIRCCAGRATGTRQPLKMEGLVTVASHSRTCEFCRREFSQELRTGRPVRLCSDACRRGSASARLTARRENASPCDLDGNKQNNSLSNLVPACNPCNSARGLFMAWVRAHKDDPYLWAMYEAARAAGPQGRGRPPRAGPRAARPGRDRKSVV